MTLSDFVFPSPSTGHVCTPFQNKLQAAEEGHRAQRQGGRAGGAAGPPKLGLG